MCIHVLPHILYYILFYKVISFFSVAKYLANRKTDIVLLYNEASYRYSEDLKLF